METYIGEDVILISVFNEYIRTNEYEHVYEYEYNFFVFMGNE